MSQIRGSSRKAFILTLAVLAVVVFWFVRDSPVEDARAFALERPSAPVDRPQLKAELVLLPPDVGEPTRLRVPLVDQGARPEGQPGAIRGIVFSPSGEPLAGAKCSLFGDVAVQGFRFGRFAHRQADSSVVAVVTDALGTFELAAPEGYWVLQVAYEGLRTWTEESVQSGSFRRVLMDRDRVLVIRVVDAEAMPIVGAEVLNLENPYSNHAGARDAGRSDLAGQVELDLQPGDSWYIKVLHPDYIGTYFEAPPFEGPLRIETTVILNRGVRIVGQVIEPRSQNAPEGALVLIDELGPAPTRTLKVDAFGRFDSGPIYAPDVQLEITARAPGLAEARRVIELQGETPVEGAVTVDFELSTSSVEVTGIVRDPDGLAAGACDVFIQPLASGEFLNAQKQRARAISWRLSARTDKEGRFQVSGLADEQVYQLLVVPEQNFSSGLVRVPPTKAGAVCDLGVIQVDRAASLFGSVRFSDGNPAVHLPLYAVRTMYVNGSDPDYFPADFDGRLDTYTNQDGDFEFPVLIGGGDYELYWGGSYAADHVVGRYLPASGERIGPIEFVLPSAHEDQRALLQGVVFDSKGTPVGSVLVEVWDGPKTEVIGAGFVKGQLTDVDGAFEILVSPTRQYRVTATDLRGRFESASFESIRYQAGQSLSFELDSGIDPAKELGGIVTDSSQTPLAGMAVTLYLSPTLVRCDCSSWSTTTDEHGRFSFGKVAQESHQVAIVDPAGKLATKMLPAIPGEEVVVEME